MNSQELERRNKKLKDVPRNKNLKGVPSPINVDHPKIYYVVDDLEVVENNRFCYFDTFVYLTKVEFKKMPLLLELCDMTVIEVDLENNRFFVQLDERQISVLNYIDHKCKDLLGDLLINHKNGGLIGDEWNYDTISFGITVEDDYKLELSFDKHTSFNYHHVKIQPNQVKLGDKVSILIGLDFIVCFLNDREARNNYKSLCIDIVSEKPEISLEKPLIDNSLIENSLMLNNILEQLYNSIMNDKPNDNSQNNSNNNSNNNSDNDDNSDSEHKPVKKTRGRKAKVIEPEPEPVIEEIKKTRGRKAKVIEPEPEPEPVIEEIKKTRGRKAKVIEPEPVIEEIKKTRGRKPKVVEEAPVIIQPVEEIKKTRGRKPKVIEEAPVIIQPVEKIKKTRGRKKAV